jgi:hypothetical protein
MRHTGVTMMLEAGVNPRVIQQLAGWTSLRMLERYGHACDVEAHRAATAMHAALDNAVNRSRDKQADSPQESIKERAHTGHRAKRRTTDESP